MGRTWVLHTETKGTGAQMVPLETTKKRSPADAPVFVRQKPRRRPEPEAETAAPVHVFRIVDVVSRETLADGARARATAEALRDVRSPVDVNIYVWREDPGRWRLLTFEEKRALWDLRDA